MAELTPVKPEIMKVASLTSDSFGERWKIYVKVKSKSKKLSSGKGTEYFKVVLEDDSGQIEALAFGSQNVHRFFDRFVENKLYFISDGKLTPNEKVPNEEQPCVENKNVKNGEQPCVENENVQNGEQPCVENENAQNGEKPCVENENAQNGEKPCVENENAENKEQPCVEKENVKNGEQPCVENENAQNGEQPCVEHEKNKEKPCVEHENVPNGEQPCDEQEEEEEKEIMHPCRIHLESGTIVTCCDVENQPSSPFTPITQLKHSTKTFVDVVGIVTGVWKLEMKYTQYRSINITDENGCDVNVALWGKLATEFDVKCISTVVALKHVRVKKENGEVELQSTPNTDVEYKPSDPEAVVLREILGIAEDLDELSDARNSEVDEKHCTRCEKHRGSNSPASHRRRNDSGTSTGRGKYSKNNLTNGAICRRRGSGTGRGRRGKKNNSNDGKRKGRGVGRRRSGTNSDDVPNDDFMDDEEDSEVEDSEVDDLRVYRKKRRPVRHCKSLYSDIGPRKSTTSVADDDDDSDSDTDDDTDDDDDSDNDKEDAKEKNVKETPKRGRPCRRSLDKDLKDASKTPSGRTTRSRTKSTTDSPKKSASSSKGPVTAISIETDDESEDDGIKPGSSSAKKSTKMGSDSDSDATVSYLEPPSSTGKRKGSDDDDEQDDEKDKNKSSKKKFKRIKTTVTSSQDSEKSVDPKGKKRVGTKTKKTDGAEESSSSSSSSSGSDTDSSDSSSSDTHSYHSGNDNNDDQWVEEGPSEDSNNIEQLREIQGDDDGMLDMLRHYILWFALKAGGENLDDDIYKETVDAKTKLDGRLEVVMNICQSQAWATNFRSDVTTYPKFVDDVKHEDLSGGDMRNLENCEVCNRESHPWSVIVKLEGEPYNKETFEMIVKEEGEESVELPPVQYYMGCFCHPRSKLYHNLYHFGYYLYQRCKEMLEERVDDEKRIDKVATDKSLLEELYSKLKNWMKEAEKDYTEDGERANSRWTREHKF